MRRFPRRAVRGGGPHRGVKDTRERWTSTPTPTKIRYEGPTVIMTGPSPPLRPRFAAALQDYGRGLVVGAPNTHGKGTVQTRIAQPLLGIDLGTLPGGAAP